MLVKISFPLQRAFFDVDMLRIKELNNFETECVLPRRLKRNLPPLPEDKECSNMELKKTIKTVHRKRRQRRLRLPALPEYDEN